MNRNFDMFIDRDSGDVFESDKSEVYPTSCRRILESQEKHHHDVQFW